MIKKGKSLRLLERISSPRLILAFICLLVFTSNQCTSRKDRASVGDSKVTVLYQGDEGIFFQDYWGLEATYLMFLPLVVLEGDEDGEPQPALAERWEHSEDYREWTFFLRKDVKWHDGVLVTAHDIKFTMDLRTSQTVMGGTLDPYSIEAIEVSDDFTLKVTYKKPTDGLDPWSVYYPKHLLEGLDPEEFFSWDFWKHPVGNGPYRYVRHVPQTMVEVEANPDYYHGKPRIERVILKFSAEDSVVELLSGNVDAIGYVERDMQLKLSGDDRFRLYHWWGNLIDAICWNHRHPLFQSPEVRRALTMAINRHELAGVLNYPEGVPVSDAITTERQFRQGLYPEPLPYDPESARKLLEKLGWQDTDGDGVRELDGKEFRFTAITPGYEKIAIYVQDRFRRIGVRMEIQALHTNYMQLLKAAEFEALIFFIGGPMHPNLGHVKMFGENSPFGYYNPELIRLLNLVKEAIDLDERDRIYREIMPIFCADLPITLLLPKVFSCAVHRRIKGLSSPFRSDPVRYMEHLWIEEGE